MNIQIEILIGNAIHKILKFKLFVMKLIFYKILKTKSDDKPHLILQVITVLFGISLNS